MSTLCEILEILTLEFTEIPQVSLPDSKNRCGSRCRSIDVSTGGMCASYQLGTNHAPYAPIASSLNCLGHSAPGNAWQPLRLGGDGCANPNRNIRRFLRSFDRPRCRRHLRSGRIRRGDRRLFKGWRKGMALRDPY